MKKSTARRQEPELAATPNVVLYLRVSTGRQAEQDLSIPDQRAQARAWCESRGCRIVAEYVEPGASATDDRRPEFQKMVERACDGENAFDIVVVHSSRGSFGMLSGWSSTSASLPSMACGYCR